MPPPIMMIRHHPMIKPTPISEKPSAISSGKIDGAGMWIGSVGGAFMLSGTGGTCPAMNIATPREPARPYFITQ